MASISVATESNPSYESINNLEVQNILSCKGYGVIGYENNFGRLVPTADITEAATLTAAQVIKNRMLVTDATGGAFNATTPTAALLAAEIVANFNYLRIGDYFTFFICNKSGNTVTFVGGTNVTLVGSGAVATATGRMCILLCTAVGTPAFSLYVV
jgi:hypothetical protein